MQSFTACIPLLTATSAFRLGRRCWSSPQQCYLHCLRTLRLRTHDKALCKSAVTSASTEHGRMQFLDTTSLCCQTYLNCKLDSINDQQMNVCCDRFPSMELRERFRLGIDDIPLVLQQNTLRWYGHELRKEDDDWVKKCMEYEAECPKPRGRPKRTRTEVVEKDCQVRKLIKDV